MTREYPYMVLNVFSDTGIAGGNQLAVITDGMGLTDEEMLNISKQFNFSETTFVMRKDDASADIRIFTPGKEISYAGHPTVGTINVLETLHRREGKIARTSITMNLKGGSVEGVIKEGDKIGFVGFSQKLASEIRSYCNTSKIASLLGISEDEIVNRNEFPINAVTEMKFLIVELKSIEALRNISPDFNEMMAPEFKDDDICIFVYTKRGLDGGFVRTRFFVPLYSINEDPATGGVQSSFCLALFHAGHLKDNSVTEIIVEQGYEIGRPSKIYNRIEIKDGKLIEVVTGGNCYHFSEGTLKI